VDQSYLQIINAIHKIANEALGKNKRKGEKNGDYMILIFSCSYREQEKSIINT